MKAYLITTLSLFVFLHMNAQVLPATFDLRNYNNKSYVSSVKSQQGGTCWTHGAMASIESNLIVNNAWTLAGDTGEPNLAEYHLDWWNGFNQHHNDDYPGFTGNGLTVHNGGDYRVTTAYLSRGEGAVRDIDGQSFNAAPARHHNSYRYYYPRVAEWYTMPNELEGIETIKNALMTTGVVGTCMCVGYWGQNNTHYQDPSTNTEPNHAVAIIGWNDSLQTAAPEPGAWLVKNSWGINWGDSGYFWISYYDKHCGREPQMGAVSFQEVERMQYNKVFYHDYHGWRETFINCTEGFNAFKNDSTYRRIDALSFFNAADSIQFTAKVYKNFKNGQLADPLSVISGDIHHIGFHTFDLDSGVVLSPGQNFYIYLYLSGGGLPYDKTSQVPVLLGAYNSSGPDVISHASPGESYYKILNGNTWVDFYTYDTTGNFCFKALANPQLPASAKPIMGDTSICNQGSLSLFTSQKSLYTKGYTWNLLPAQAGNVFAGDTFCYIQWDSTFIGQASLELTPYNNNGTGTKSTYDIQIHPNPVVNLGADTNIYLSASLHLDAGLGYSFYTWSNNTNSSSTTFYGQDLGLGSHQVWVEVENQYGCKTTDTINIQVMPDVSIHEISPSNIALYPNPVLSTLTIEIPSAQVEYSEIEIIDFSGKLVYQKIHQLQQGTNSLQIDLSHLNAGVYHIRIKQNQQIYNQKITIN